MIEWQVKRFDQLKTDELYEALRVRQEVFSVEQNCPYQDLDSLDKVSWHIYTSDKKTGEVLAYLRIVDAGCKYDEVSIGRVLTTKPARGMGLGKALIQKSLEFLNKEAPKSPIRISAQLYLQKFYEDFGFEVVSAPYDEDDIPHIEMLKCL